MPTNTSRHYTWWRVSGHVVACSGDGARGNAAGGPNRVPLLPSYRVCTLHHGSVQNTPRGIHLKKPTFVKDLAGNIPAFQADPTGPPQHAIAPARDQRILSQVQPPAAHMLITTLPAKGAQRQWVISQSRNAFENPAIMQA